MTRTLPPERDLPPARERQIRDELIKTVSGPSTRHRARWLVPATAAATAIAVAGVGYGVTALGGDGTGPAQPVATTMAPAPSPSAAPRPEPVVPGISPQRALQIAQGCAAAFGPGIEHPADLRLYNLVTDAAGTSALVLGSNLGLDCAVGGPVAEYNPGGGRIDNLDWLPGQLAPSGVRAAAGEGANGKYGRRRGVEEISGRVGAGVTNIRVTFRDGTVEVTPLNGTFLARMVHPEDWNIPDRLAEPQVRGYDAAGAEIRPPDPRKECYVTPTGTVIFGEATTGCKPAVRWR